MLVEVTSGLRPQFAPGTSKFIGSDIKVHGTMSADAAQDDGHPVLRVKVGYIMV